jgi:hypothetical protein
VTTTPPADPSVEGASDRRPVAGSKRPSASSTRTPSAGAPASRPNSGSQAVRADDVEVDEDDPTRVDGEAAARSAAIERAAVEDRSDPGAPVAAVPTGIAVSPARRVLGYRRERFEARKVRRLIRHVDPWSMLKLSVMVALCMWLIVMIAAVVLWTVARNAGTISNVESFVNSSLSLQDWRLDGEFIFRQFGLITLLLALGFAAATVVASLVFNLISDIIGGVWVSVIEEETARPVAESNPGERVG